MLLAFRRHIGLITYKRHTRAERTPIQLPICALHWTSSKRSAGRRARVKHARVGALPDFRWNAGADRLFSGQYAAAGD